MPSGDLSKASGKVASSAVHGCLSVRRIMFVDIYAAGLDNSPISAGSTVFLGITSITVVEKEAGTSIVAELVDITVFMDKVEEIEINTYVMIGKSLSYAGSRHFTPFCGTWKQSIRCPRK